MIYYFSGTGNSTFVAVTLSNFLNQELRFIPEIKQFDEEENGERVIFVFPVYSWGVPPLVLEFIERLGENYWQTIIEKNLPVDCVMTCGDEVAMAPEMIEKVLGKFGVRINSVWSVIMPNNYVLLPGFDVDAKELENKKLKECEGRIMEIAVSLSKNEKRIDVVRGSWPRFKTGLIYPLFKKWGVFPKKWHSTPSCIGCRKCSEICPQLNITMKEKTPEWGLRCCSCLACYHVCPVHAVEYGKETLKKGQYLFPLKKISLRNCHK